MKGNKRNPKTINSVGSTNKIPNILGLLRSMLDFDRDSTEIIILTNRVFWSNLQNTLIHE